MADCSYYRCIQERRFIKRELQKWCKDMVYIVGEFFFSLISWRKLFFPGRKTSFPRFSFPPRQNIAKKLLFPNHPRKLPVASNYVLLPFYLVLSFSISLGRIRMLCYAVLCLRSGSSKKTCCRK